MVTLFTPWNWEFGRLPPVKLDDVVIPHDNNPKLLGVTFNPMFTFLTHILEIVRKSGKRNNILHALSDLSFGHDKECLTANFKSLIRPLLDYAAPIVYPNYSATSIRQLQLIQNCSLRLVTGCHSAASVDHLHSESGVLPVKPHSTSFPPNFLPVQCNLATRLTTSSFFLPVRAA